MILRFCRSLCSCSFKYLRLEPLTSFHSTAHALCGTKTCRLESNSKKGPSWLVYTPSPASLKSYPKWGTLGLTFGLEVLDHSPHRSGVQVHEISLALLTDVGSKRLWLSNSSMSLAHHTANMEPGFQSELVCIMVHSSGSQPVHLNLGSCCIRHPNY